MVLICFCTIALHQPRTHDLALKQNVLFVVEVTKEQWDSWAAEQAEGLSCAAQTRLAAAWQVRLTGMRGQSK
jgi:hypothetical protein